MTRRDFLKKASKDTAREVVETGSKIVPGGQLAKRFLESGDESKSEFVEEPRRHWWDRFVIRHQENGK